MTISAQAVASYLEKLAKSGEVTTYSGLAKYFGVPRITSKDGWKKSPFRNIFIQLDIADKEAGRPLRTSVVVKKDGYKKTIPTDAYFKSLCEYREIAFPSNQTEKYALHEEEQRRLKLHYNPNLFDPDEFT